MKRILATLLLALSVGLMPGAAWALTYSPPTFDETAIPGGTVNDVLKLRNETKEQVIVTASTLNFTGRSGDETDGVPEFYPADKVRDGHGLAPWISFKAGPTVIAPGGQADLPFTIKIPINADPGSYFGAVILGTQALGDGTVGVVGNAAALILLRVSGEVREDLRLTSFSAAPASGGRLPVRFEARVQDAGNVHERPYGSISISDPLGRVVAVLPVNRAELKSVLPGGTRRFQATWGSDGARAFLFGPYKAKLDLSYGDRGRTLTAETGIWLFPWATSLLGLIAVAALGFAFKAFFAWYHKRITAQHGRK